MRELCKPSRAFTLIELLVVIAIMLILAAMLLVAAGLLRDSAEVLTTKERMRNLQRELIAVENSGTTAQDLLTGSSYRWQNIKRIVSTLKAEHGLQLDNPAHYEKLPPRVHTVYDTELGSYRYVGGGNQTWDPLLHDRHLALDKVGHTLDKQLTISFLRDFTNFDSYYHRAIGGKYPLKYEWENGPKSGQRTFLFWHRSRWPYDAGGGGLRYCWLYAHEPATGERIHSTQELVPDALWDRQDYLDRWPTLSETLAGNTLVQRAWPDSDWDRADPGTVAPIWEMPWGSQVFSRVDGELHEQILHRTAGDGGRSLADCSPLATIGLLQLASALPAGTAGAMQYRTTRNREHPYNDRWGNPLILTAAAFIAPRYDLDPADPADASHGKAMEFSLDLKGGREWLRTRSEELFGTSRSCYVAVGALGPKRGEFGDDNPIASEVDSWLAGGDLVWSVADEADPIADRQVLRAAWLQIRELCRADRWDEAAMIDPIWDDAEKGEKGAYLSLLSQPFELR